MNLSNNTYRFERKFVFEDDTLENVIQSNVFSNSFLFKEVYERRTVNNIYFDDWNHSFYKMNVSGVGVRSKYRLRWYNDDYNIVSNPTLEIKRKNGEVGDKLLFKLPNLSMDIEPKTAHEVYSQMQNEISDTKLRSEIDRLHPVLYNSYERRYFLSADENFRITIDYNMRFYNPNVDRYSLTELKIPDIILELKYNTEDDDLGRKLSQSFGRRLSKNSKYVRGCDLHYYEL